jgi:hypothetical protein
MKNTQQSACSAQYSKAHRKYLTLIAMPAPAKLLVHIQLSTISFGMAKQTR